MVNLEVSDFIKQINVPWHAELCGQLRNMIHEAVPDVQERIQYRKPHFLKNGKYAAVISPSKSGVSFTIFNTADVDVPSNLFEGPPERKTIKIKEGQAVDFQLLTELFVQASASL